jgi:metallo-beta-lactamase class B
MKLVLAFLLGTLLLAQAPPRLQSDPAKNCESCDEWNGAVDPFKVFGNTYYVGARGVSSVLVTSDDGHILLDGGLPQTAAMIDAHVKALGFRTEDIRLIVNSHAHFDHAGGIAAIERLSGATVAASPSGARALEAGGPMPDDPQFAFGHESNGFPPVAHVRAAGDGEVLHAGRLALTAHWTPGHTPGSTAWTWRSCEGDRCLDIVYADSLNAVSAPGFRFTGDKTYPGRVDAFRKSIATVAALPCDILLSAHPWGWDMDGKLHRVAEGARENPFVDASGCRTYAKAALEGLEKRIAEER